MAMKYEDITKRILAASFQVHSTLGNGFQDVIYQRALEIEFPYHNLDFKREMEMPIYYRNTQIGTRRVDFFVKNLIMVELKAVIKLEDVHLAQAINYLEAYNMKIGMLINFGSKSLEYHRLTNKKYKEVSQIL
jgi:GxxExxY protein